MQSARFAGLVHLLPIHQPPHLHILSASIGNSRKPFDSPAANWYMNGKGLSEDMATDLRAVLAMGHNTFIRSMKGYIYIAEFGWSRG